MTFPVDSSYIDGNGKQVLLSDNVRAVEAVDLTGSAFWSPNATFTGFGADGNYYLNGAGSTTRATWADEDEGPHRGTLNRFPQRFFAVLTDAEVSLIAADTFDLFLRFKVLEIPAIGDSTYGIFLDWVEDDSLPGLGTGLGIQGDALNDVGWADGRLIVAGDNGTRVFDFREDRIHAFRDSGSYRHHLAAQSGIKFRNLSNYYGPTLFAVIGPSFGTTVTTLILGTNAYYVVGSLTGVTVFKWTANGIGSLQTRATSLGGESRGQDVQSDGELYILIKYDDGGSDRLKVIRSISEWQSVGSGFSGSVHQSSLPLWVGGEGRMVLYGDKVYVGVGSGIWSTNRYGLTSFTLLYGKTLTAVEPIAPTYEILPQIDDAITNILIDQTTGNLAILFGSWLVLVHLGKHIINAAYSTALSSNPKIPSAPVALASYNFAVGDI